MKIAIAGHTGLIGSYLKEKFISQELVLLNRSDLYSGIANLQIKIKNCDVVFNLAGAPIAQRWTRKKKDIILKSRVNSTQNLVDAINGLDITKKPKMFFNASAIGIYDDVNVHSEDSLSFSNDFMGNVVKEWEAAAGKLDNNVSLVIMRLGIVLSKQGGALTKLLKLYKFYLGGTVGPGNQLISFIHIEDLYGAIIHIMNNELKGIFNFTTENPLSNSEFGKSIASAMNRPNFFYIPPIALKIILGEASEILTKGQNVLPKRLIDSGYIFSFATSDKAIIDIINKK